MMNPDKSELLARIEKVYASLNKTDSNWDAIFFVDKLNQFYFTNTMQNAIFVIRKDGEYAYFVRGNYERAKKESVLDNIYPMTSYKSLLSFLDARLSKVYLETKIVTLEILERINKYFEIEKIMPIDGIISVVRSVKSPYELSLMEQSGRQHSFLLETVTPGLLKEGMSEAELTAALYYEMIKLGYQGVTRFSMFQTDMIIGQLGFGESSISPVCFDGPGGNLGICNAVPTCGSRDVFLKKGDLVFVDIGFGYNGYHTDRTQLYMFGKNPDTAVEKIHRECLNIQTKTAALLKPGAKPSDIYSAMTETIDKTLLTNFMGYGDKTVNFLGHGIGLQIDEYPVIAKGFDEPLAENMVIALEPKNGVEGVGLLGGEDSYVVTPNGGRCLTGGPKDIIVV